MIDKHLLIAYNVPGNELGTQDASIKDEIIPSPKELIFWSRRETWGIETNWEPAEVF